MENFLVPCWHKLRPLSGGGNECQRGDNASFLSDVIHEGVNVPWTDEVDADTTPRFGARTIIGRQLDVLTAACDFELLVKSAFSYFVLDFFCPTQPGETVSDDGDHAGDPRVK